MFLDYKEKAAIVEAPTIRGYRHESKLVCRYIGELRLGDVGIPDVNGFMASMTADGYAPKSVQGAFRLMKQAFKWAQAQDILPGPALRRLDGPRRRLQLELQQLRPRTDSSHQSAQVTAATKARVSGPAPERMP